MSNPGLTKYGKWCEAILNDLGYEYQGRAGNGHLIYTHAQAGEIHISGTAFDGPVRGRFLSEMRRRHPESCHPLLFPHKSAEPARPRPSNRKRADRQRARANRSIALSLAGSVSRAPSAPAAPEHTGCGECGRRWLSDISPIGRVCPQCGAAIVIGKDWAA